MVSQSDWRPMMMATGGLSVIVNGTSPSGDDIRNDLILDLRQLVLDDKLLLLHALNAQSVTAGGNHGIDRGVIIFMLLTQTSRHEPDFRLFLIGHLHSPLSSSDVVRSADDFRKLLSPNSGNGKLVLIMNLPPRGHVFAFDKPSKICHSRKVDA
jgi:hypothetical protein